MKTTTTTDKVQSRFRKRLVDYTEAPLDTPKSIRLQKIVDYYNSMLPKYVKLFIFQEGYRSNTYVVDALAMKGCPKKWIGGNRGFMKNGKTNTDGSTFKYPDGAISNFLNMGINGTVEAGYKYVESFIEYSLAQYLKRTKNIEVDRIGIYDSDSVCIGLKGEK